MNRYSAGFYLLSFSHVFLIPLLLFSCDLVALSLLHNDYFHTLASFTLVCLLQKRISPIIILCAALLGIFSFVTTGLVLTNLIFTAGFLTLTKAFSFYSTHKRFLAFITSILLTLIPLLFSVTPLAFCLPYTIFGITGNLITVYFSLKWSPAVKRGNRS